MSRRRLLLPSFLLFTASIALSQTQTFQPKTIQFQGDSEYTASELAAAADLKQGAVFTAAEMNDHTKLLMDSGLFENISFNFNGQDLIFQLAPSTDLYPIRLENLPLADGKELDDRLRAHFPLYRGKLPTSGGLLDGVRKELEDELAAKGIQATVVTSPYEDQKLDKITAIDFAITSPPILVGEIQLQGASSAFAERAHLTAARALRSTFSNQDTTSQLESSIANFYTEQGYLKAVVHATAQPALVVDTEGAHVPFTVTIDEGLQFKLLEVKLAPGLVVTQEAFDKQSDLHSGEVVPSLKLRQNWAYIARQYHNAGFLRAKVQPTATLNLTQGTASYNVTVDPGPVYTMGAFKMSNVADDLRNAVAAEWKIPPGTVFNEGAIMTLTAVPSLAKIFAIADLRYTLNLHDDVRTVDVDLRLVRKQP